jgi:hypothetical protein
VKPPALTVLLVAVLAIAGCNDSASNDTPSPAQDRSTTTDTEAGDPVVALERAVRAAILENNELSQYVLWHNRVPSSAQRSTRGRALATLRKSAADRRGGRLRVQTLKVDVEVRDIQIDPSYSRATASVRQRGRVRLFRNGRRLRRPIALDERNRFQLRRVGDGTRFVVWEVEPAR